MRPQKLDRKHARTWRVLTTALLIVVAFFVLQENLSVVSRGLKLAIYANSGWVYLCVALMALTFCLAAAIYSFLTLHPLRYRQTLLVQVAAAFVGRLLPAGIGGLGLNGVYLYKRKHTAAEATVVTSVNNLIGMCAHLLLLCLVVLIRPHVISQLFEHFHSMNVGAWIVVCFIVIASVLLLPVIRNRIVGFGQNLLISLRKESPRKICIAVVFSVLLTLTYASILFSASRSVHVCLSLVQIFIVFTAGVLVGTVTPAPGGLVGTEAGLYSALLGFGASTSGAAATVLIFRLVTYWMPLIPGALALALARNKKLV